MFALRKCLQVAIYFFLTSAHEYKKQHTVILFSQALCSSIDPSYIDSNQDSLRIENNHGSNNLGKIKIELKIMMI